MFHYLIKTISNIKMKVKLKKYNSIGIEELNAAKKVVSSGKLSEFVAGNTKDFFGGSNIKKF